jgi:uncharacterized protein (TIGR02453 family)
MRAVMPKTPHFTPELFKFLRQLDRNNTRDWFTANKTRYEQHVRDPLLAFIADFKPRLAKISPHLVADPHPTRGSMFRIYRDTRFSRDKRPYKTWVAAQFRHEAGKDAHAPGFYLHIAPDNVFAGAGIWHPDGAALAHIRDALVENGTEWKRATSAKAFRSHFELEGDSLKRAPKGYDPDHPLIDHIKRKDFIGVAHFEPQAVQQAAFLDRYTATVRSATPFMKFLTNALSVAW